MSLTFVISSNLPSIAFSVLCAPFRTSRFAKVLIKGVMECDAFSLT